MRCGAVIVLPIRNPVVLAKELASVHVVADGRLIVGVGAEYVTDAFDAIGVPWQDGETGMDEVIDAMRGVVVLDHPQHSGPSCRSRKWTRVPARCSALAPPIVVGQSRAALRRAITKGNGWCGFGVDPALARQCVEAIRQLSGQHERILRNIGTILQTLTHP